MIDEERAVTAETLRRLLNYDAETGRLTWRARAEEFFNEGRYSAARAAASWNKKHAGKPAFTAHDAHGYLFGRILGANYKAHRVAWAIVYGDWPNDQIDHVNHIRDDNRLTNLRVVKKSDNCKNISLRSDNSTGANGVYLNKRNGKFYAQAKVDGQTLSLGTYRTFDEAKVARFSANRALGFHPNHGKVVANA